MRFLILHCALWRCFYVIEFFFTQEVICKELKIHKTEKALVSMNDKPYSFITILMSY